MNSVTLKGRLGKDPELKTTKTGKSVCTLRLAVSSGYGENKKTDWFDVVFWASLADLASKSLEKGQEILVTGKLVNREYTNKDNQKIRVTEIVANSLGYVEDRTENKAVAVDDSDIP